MEVRSLQAETNSSGDGSDYDGDTFSDTLQEPTTDKCEYTKKSKSCLYTVVMACIPITLIYIRA